MASQTAVEWYGKKCFSSWSIAFSNGITIIPSESLERDSIDIVPFFFYTNAGYGR